MVCLGKGFSRGHYFEVALDFNEFTRIEYTDFVEKIKIWANDVQDELDAKDKQIAILRDSLRQVQGVINKINIDFDTER